jgi:sigma-B regulation protein RsbU (phosphoserine phosphatase)
VQIDGKAARGIILSGDAPRHEGRQWVHDGGLCLSDPTDISTLRELKPGDLPSPPDAALGIVRACSRGDVANADLSRIAGSDPVLTAELLRVANSPFFGAGRDIRSLTRAITVLGQVTVRNLALCLAVRQSIRSSRVAGIEGETFWEDALIRGAGARMLGRIGHHEADECLTAGILQDFGMHVMLYLQPTQATRWPEMRMLDPDARRMREREVFGLTHDDVNRRLAQAWDLPADLARALAGHHQCDDRDAIEVSPLARILYLADWMAAVFRGVDKGAAIRRYRDIAERHLDLAASQADELLAALPSQVNAAACALGLSTSFGLDLSRVLAEADLFRDEPGC